MMELLVERIASDADTTIGLFWINGIFRTFTCEDEFRLEKVTGETRIPAGEYRVALRTNSPMADRYGKRFGTWHDGMIWIIDVPNFEYVYIHVGNTDNDSSGCILVGYGAMARRAEGMNIQQSRSAYVEIAKDIFAAFKIGEQVNINIVDRDGKDW